MLVVAGVIEGFFSPSHVPVAMKFSLAAVALGASADVFVRDRQAKSEKQATADSSL